MEITIVLGASFWLWVAWAVAGALGIGSLVSGIYFAGDKVAIAVWLVLLTFIGLSVWLLVSCIVAGSWWGILPAIPLALVAYALIGLIFTGIAANFARLND